ncbi:MAG TPA: hypothetical protein PKL88_00610 [bacterium]|nr:hypothetical protein [bacterium]
MKPIEIFKLFILDWIVTLLMYVVGFLITGLGDFKSADINFYISNLNTAPTGVSPLLAVFTYLLTSILFVILISYLINNSYIKYSKKTFLVSQLMYLVSLTMIVFSITLLV